MVKRKAAAIMIFLAGAFLFLYPNISEFIADTEQEELLENWDTTEEAQAQETARKSYGELNRVFEREREDTSEQQSDQQEEQTEAESSQTIGVLRIPVIASELPIVEGATEENLRVAAGHLAGTSFLEPEGNTAIAAHRSHTEGRMFNRLDELESGDEFIIEKDTGQKTFTIFNKTVVSPSDTSVLSQETNGESVVTLITCTPMKNPTHRLIVQGKYE
ncbi:class D sortase [Salibacterium salarium]|uniref:Class D sortase n=1 Tax=Salibacterium salarium TaxID=284579 RepID=A0A428MW33_9BACI|nr:class D sortase [Salibacterium salarium]RSL30304.1 class D sortase [Salibacterium salarium]